VTAGLVVLLMAVGLAGWAGWSRHDRALRRAAHEQVVMAALADSYSWQEQRRLPEALSAARRAAGLLAGGEVSAQLRQQVQARLADLELLDRLENVRLEAATAVKGGHFDFEGADALYRQRFREVGLDVEALSAEEAGQRIGRSTVAVELAAVLDGWAWRRRTITGPDDPGWKHLLHVARLADPDGTRTRLRLALEKGDRQVLRRLVVSEEALHLPPSTQYVLGLVLTGDKESHGALERFLLAAQHQTPNDFWLNYNLWLFFTVTEPARSEERLRFAAAAVVIRPESPGARLNLGNALQAKGRLAEAIAEYRKAIQIKKDYADAYESLGAALQAKGRLDEAIIEYRKAIQINKDYALAHNNLGNALKAKGRLDEAITEYRKAIQSNKDYAEAYCNLGFALLHQGQLAEALAYLQRGHQLGSSRPGWPYPSAQWVRHCERLLDLDRKLPDILAGQKQTDNVEQRLALAQLCQQQKHLYGAAVCFYTEAFADKPQLADDVTGGHCYNAACAAALAGCAKGKDADRLDKQRTRLRQQALDWLHADLQARQRQLQRWGPGRADEARQGLQHWLVDADLAGVRGEALAKLPNAERQAWRTLWADVAGTLARARGPAPAQKKLDNK
jgi:tetratricopeptide (TPR) repeat protein